MTYPLCYSADDCCMLDQLLGAGHYKRWSKNSFLVFLHGKLKKGRKRRQNEAKTRFWGAAVSCSAGIPRLGEVKMGLGLTCKLGRALVGAWVGALVIMRHHHAPMHYPCTDPCKA